MNDNEKSVQKAMRIFEALSAVDEELLIACNKNDEKKDKVIPFWKYGKVIAACFCLFVAGVLVLSASVTNGFRSAKTSDCATANENESVDGSCESADVDLTVQENGCSVEESVLEQEMAIEDSFQADDTKSGLQTQSITLVPVDEGEEIDEFEAKKVEVYGAYIPDVLPDGYTFASGKKVKDPKTGEEIGVSLTWTKGMDSISWTVKQMDAKEVVCVDISNTEYYDVHMYEIPYADTVPGEYREVFTNPVFKAEDMGLQLVEKRMKVVQDAGDTDTPRGNFSIFYDQGILIEFSGNGTAQEIWNLFASL